MADIFKFDIGDRVKDRISGFTGIIQCRTEWFNGCIRYNVVPDALDAGKLIPGDTFDEAQLELKKMRAVQAPKHTFSLPARRTGGPRNDPKAQVAKR